MAIVCIGSKSLDMTGNMENAQLFLVGLKILVYARTMRQRRLKKMPKLVVNKTDAGTQDWLKKNMPPGLKFVIRYGGYGGVMGYTIVQEGTGSAILGWQLGRHVIATMDYDMEYWRVVDGSWYADIFELAAKAEKERGVSIRMEIGELEAAKAKL